MTSSTESVAIVQEPVSISASPSAREIIERELDLFNYENVRYMGRVGGLNDWLKTRRDNMLAAFDAKTPPAAPIWRTDSDTPKDRPFMVAMQEDDGSIEYHVAKWTGADRAILVIGSMFAFDHGGKAIGWAEIEPIAAPAPASERKMA